MSKAKIYIVLEFISGGRLFDKIVSFPSPSKDLPLVFELCIKCLMLLFFTYEDNIIFGF